MECEGLEVPEHVFESEDPMSLERNALFLGENISERFSSLNRTLGNGKHLVLKRMLVTHMVLFPQRKSLEEMPKLPSQSIYQTISRPIPSKARLSSRWNLAVWFTFIPAVIEAFGSVEDIGLGRSW